MLLKFDIRHLICQFVGNWSDFCGWLVCFSFVVQLLLLFLLLTSLLLHRFLIDLSHYHKMYAIAWVCVWVCVFLCEIGKLCDYNWSKQICINHRNLTRFIEKTVRIANKHTPPIHLNWAIQPIIGHDFVFNCAIFIIFFRLLVHR